MPPRTVEFHSAAVKEADAAFSWYAERNLLAARAFTQELNHSVEMIREAPERWPQFGSTARRYVMPLFPFSLVYRLKGQGVEIIARWPRPDAVNAAASGIIEPSPLPHESTPADNN